MLQSQTLVNLVAASRQMTKIATAQAQKLAQVKQATEKVAGLVPAVLNAMITNGAAAPHEKDACETMLRDHGMCLSLLKSAVEKNVALRGELQKMASTIEALEKRAGVKATELGEGAADGGEKTAGADDSYDPLQTPYIGRRTSKLSPADRILAGR